MDERITAIEHDLSHQGRLTEVLNDVVYEQGRQIEMLRKVIQKLESKVRMLEERAGGSETGAATAEEESPWKDPEM